MLKNTLSLVIPNLLTTSSVSECIALQTWLRHAEITPAPQDAELFFHLFNITIDPKQLPIAAITAFADGLEARNGWWIRVDPVQLIADQAQVFLVGNTHLDLTQAEAAAFLAELNSFLASDNLRLQMQEPMRWYLQLDHALKIETVAPEIAMRSGMLASLPTGPQQTRWRMWLTELQLLLHQSPTNQQRSKMGKPPVNAVWLWGGGYLPSCQQQPSWRSVASDDIVLQGLAQLINIPIYQTITSYTAWQTQIKDLGDHLIMLNASAAASFENDWFKPLLQALRKQQIEKIVLYPGDGQCYTLTRARLSWWKRLFIKDQR